MQGTVTTYSKERGLKTLSLSIQNDKIMDSQVNFGSFQAISMWLSFRSACRFSTVDGIKLVILRKEF